MNKLNVLKYTPKDNYTPEENLFLTHLLDVEEKYMGLINLGLKAQEAREILPLATKCDMVMTGFVSDWEHLCRLRSSFAETGQPFLQGNGKLVFEPSAFFRALQILYGK